MQVINVDLE